MTVDALGIGGGDRTGCEVAGVVGVAVTQPFLEACCTHPAQSVRSLVPGQQNQCGLAVCEVESPFQGWEILQQLSAQTVDCAVPIGCEISAAGAEYAEIHGSFVTVTQWVEVSAHPCLVGDDRGVLRIGLAVTAVGARGVMHDPSRDVEELLVVVEQQRDQQRRAAGIQIDRPSNRAAIS